MKYKCKICNRKREEVILILDLNRINGIGWVCLECLLSDEAQNNQTDSKEVDKTIKFYTYTE